MEAKQTIRGGLDWPLMRENVTRAEVFNPGKRAMPLAAGVKRSDSSTVAFTLGDAHIGVSASEQQFRQFPRQFFEQQFREADAGKKGVVDRKQAMTDQFLSQIFDFVDRNGDGKLTLQELSGFLDLHGAGARALTTLTVVDQGIAVRAEVVHLGTVGLVVVDHDQPVLEAEADRRLQFAGTHEGAADEREVVSGRRDACRIFRRGDAAFRHPRNARRQSARERLQPTGHHFERVEIAAIDTHEERAARRIAA